MSISSSVNSVDPRPRARRVQADSVGLTTATINYTQGDILGSHIVFNNMARFDGGAATVATATLVDKSNSVGAVDLHLFSQQVTPANDNQQAGFSDIDMNHYVGTLSFPAPIQFTNSQAVTLPAVGLTFITQSNTALWGYLVTLTNHTFFNMANDITISLVVYQY